RDLGAATQPLDSFLGFRISPDGRRVAEAIMSPDGIGFIAMHEPARGIHTPFTTGPVARWNPVWSPDGRRVTFAASSGAPPDIVIKSLDDPGPGQLVLHTGDALVPTDWSPDGRLLLIDVGRIGRPGLDRDLWVLPLAGERKPVALLETTFDEGNAVFSPDSRSLAFVSDESGRPEVYVQAFRVDSPALYGERRRVSTAGGVAPRWSRDGRELFFVSGDNQLMSAAVRGGEIARPAPLFRVRTADFEVSPDGRRFLVRVPSGDGIPTAITVVVNWPASLAGRGVR
ncbi:MAG: TolB family protein, partial [Bryobacteraceae bacterium]